MKGLFYIIIGCFFCCSITTMNAQNVSSVSKAYPALWSKYKAYLQKGEEVLMVKFEYKKTVFQKVNITNLELGEATYSKSYPKLTPNKVMEWGGKYYVFYTSLDKKAGSENISCIEIDFDKGAFIGELKTIVTSGGLVHLTPNCSENSCAMQSTIPIAKFDFITSFDKSKLLIGYQLAQSSIVGVHVFDQKMNVLSALKVKFPYGEEKVLPLDYRVGSEGNTYVVAKIHNKTWAGQNVKSGKIRYDLELFKVGKDGTATGTKIKLDGKGICHAWLAETADHTMKCVGTYNLEDNQSLSGGVFIGAVDKAGKVINIVTKQLPTSKKEHDSDLLFDKLISNKDGSNILIFGREGLGIFSYFGEPTSYYYDDFILKENADGTIPWIYKLPKKQYNGEGYIGQLSCKYARSKDYHYVFFMDHPNNSEAYDLEAKVHFFNDPGHGYLVAYKVADETGQISKHRVLDIDSVHGHKVGHLSMNKLHQVSGNELIMEVYKKKKEDVILKIKLE
jgi:hypothetical protein